MGMETKKTTEEQLAKALELLGKADRHLLRIDDKEAQSLSLEIFEFEREVGK